MDLNKPITPDVLTVPRKEAAAANLVGLSRAMLREALAGVGIPEKQLNMRVGQIWQWLYVKGVTSFDQMTNL